MVKCQKILIKTVIFILAISTFISSDPIWAEDTPMENDIIAEWIIDDSMNKEERKSISANYGELKDSGNLTISNNRNIKVNMDGYFISNNWTNGANKKYWELTNSTIGYSNINLNLYSFSTSAGPKYFSISLSIDKGDTWIEISNFTSEPLSAFLSGPTLNIFTLPSIANNQDLIIMRINMESNDSMTLDREIIPGGINCLANISIYGTIIPDQKETDTPDVPDTPDIKDDTENGQQEPEDTNLEEEDKPPLPNEEITPSLPNIPEVPLTPEENSPPSKPIPPKNPEYIEINEPFYEEDIKRDYLNKKTLTNQESSKVANVKSIHNIQNWMTKIIIRFLDKISIKLPQEIIRMLQSIHSLY